MSEQNPEAMAAEAAQKSAEANVHYMAMKYYCDKEMPVFVDEDKGRQDTIEKAFVAGAEWQKSRAQQKPPMEAEEAADRFYREEMEKTVTVTKGIRAGIHFKGVFLAGDANGAARERAKAEANLLSAGHKLSLAKDEELALKGQLMEALEKISTLEKRIEFLEQVEIRVKDKGIKERDERIAALENDCRLYAEEKVHLLKERDTLSGIVVELAEALYDYRHIPAPGDRVTQYSSAAEALAKLEAFLDKEGK